MQNNKRVKIGNELIQTVRGVNQGSVASPDLFNLFIETLIKSIKATGIICRFYADDGLIIAKDLTELRKAFKII
jgi:retron-type reverse transcriptase